MQSVQDRRVAGADPLYAHVKASGGGGPFTYDAVVHNESGRVILTLTGCRFDPLPTKPDTELVESVRKRLGLNY